MKASILLFLVCFLLTIGAQAQTRVLTEEQYHKLTEMTRRQADTLQLNEHDFIKLLYINRKILLREWYATDQKQVARKEEEK